jgi:mannosyl-3-phosphoglycerate phosphatase
MVERTVQWLVITDLDGTLLDHHSYAYAAALTTITELQEKNIPVILNTSKTYAETITIRQTLGLCDAFIVENGSCLYLPKEQFSAPPDAVSRDDYWAIVMGAPQPEISEALQQLRLTDQQCIRLSCCSIEQAVALTGLSETQAAQAISREFSEPLIWQADDAALQAFQKQLEVYGLTTLQGGRFLHVIGDCDKGRASVRLLECYGDRVKPETVKVIALGDSANDAAMLAVADIAIIVNSPSNHQLSKLVCADILTKAAAPQGWQEGISTALTQLHLI